MVASLLAIGGGAGAEEAVYVVPEGEQTATFSFWGDVQSDRARSVAIQSDAKDLVIDRVCPAGAQLLAGDPIIVLDAKMVEQRLPQLRSELVAAERTLELHSLRLDQDMEQLLDERLRLRGDLDSCRAALATATVIDTRKVAALKGALDLAEQNAVSAARTAEAARIQHEAGQLSDADFDAARDAAELARIDTLSPKAEWLIASGGVESLPIAKLRLREAQLVTQLGLGADGVPDPTLAINSRIAAVASQQQRQREADTLERDAAATRLHEALRDARDHTPVASLEISPRPGAPAAAVMLKIAFAPAGTPVAEGFALDDGAVFSAARGYGWAEDATGLMVVRSATDTKPDVKPDPKQDGKTAGKPPRALALVEGLATWRAALADGPYHLKATFGDTLDWSGALAHVSGMMASSGVGADAKTGGRSDADASADPKASPKADSRTDTDADANGGSTRQGAFFVSKRVDAGAAVVVEIDIDVVGGRLEVAFGDRIGKAYRAPLAGVVTLRDWVHPGGRPWNVGAKLGFFIDPTQLTVHARVHQDDAPLLKAAGAPAPPEMPSAEAGATALVAAAQARLATAEVSLQVATGATARGTVSAISNQPAALSRAPMGWSESVNDLDRMANELDIAVDRAEVGRLRYGADVLCSCALKLPAGLRAVPSQLVVSTGNQRCVNVEGRKEPLEVVGFRVGEQFIACRGIAAGMRLVTPHAAAAPKPELMYGGTVAAALRTPVALGGFWGRIKEMVPDGSMVTSGQVIVSLYNPMIDEQKVAIERDRRKANQAYLLAAESRRVKSVQAAIEQSGRAATARAARLALEEALAIPALARAQADAESDKSRITARSKQRLLAGSEALASRDPARYAAAKADAGQAGVSARQHELQQVAALRATDWLKVCAAEYAWIDAIAELGAREDDDQLLRVEERVSGMTAKLDLERALTGSHQQAEFDRVKDLHAPASGRIFYLMGFNDQTRSRAKFQKDFPVWSGFPIAEILDLSKLSLRAELPEPLYRRMAVGGHAAILFPQFNNRRIEAAISSIGRLIAPPKDHRDQGASDHAVARDGVFTITVDFVPPPDLAQVLVPGTKGNLVLQ